MTDIVDIATVEISREMESKLGRRNFLFRSLKRSRQVCAECGEPIPKERQQAVPGCRFCVDCQEEKERAKHAIR